MPSHSHIGTTDANGSHTHTSNANGANGYGLMYQSGSNTMNSPVNDGNEPDLYQPIGALTINSSGSHQHTFTSATTGSGTSHNNMQPYVVIRYFIKY